MSLRKLAARTVYRTGAQRRRHLLIGAVVGAALVTLEMSGALDRLPPGWSDPDAAPVPPSVPLLGTLSPFVQFGLATVIAVTAWHRTWVALGAIVGAFAAIFAQLIYILVVLTTDLG